MKQKEFKNFHLDLRHMNESKLMPPFDELYAQFSALFSEKLEPNLLHRYLKEMLPNFDTVFYRKMALFASRLINHSFPRIVLSGEKYIQELGEKDNENTYVFVCNHRSNADYLILPMILRHYGLPPVYALANNKLNFFPFGSTFKKVGAFFVRQGEKRPEYFDILEELVNSFLEHRFNMIVFPEGGLSDDGFFRRAKTGFLRIVLGARKPDNVYFVPVCFAYDRVPEDWHLSFKKNHKPEDWTFWKRLQFLGFIRKYGDSYVKFYKPFQLSQWVKQNPKLGAENLVQNIFDQFRKDPVLSPSAILASIFKNHVSIDFEEMKERYYQECDRFAPYLLFDAEEKLQSIFDEWQRRKLILYKKNSKNVIRRNKNMLLYYAHQKDEVLF